MAYLRLVRRHARTMWIAIDILIIAMLWLGVVLTLPHLSGWNKLASVYRAQGPPSGERFQFEWAKVGEIYTWNITVYRSQDGIYLVGSRLLREPSLLIPWSELRNPCEKRLLFRQMQEFDLGSPSVGTLQLRSEIVKDRVQVV